MKLKFKALVVAMALGTVAAASAQGTGPIKIGIITDMSSLYADIDGPAGAEMLTLHRPRPVNGSTRTACKC
jgi:branched-chain amino acid transport system substrate-binding protein